MASRYSVNGNKPPFFAKLAEARAYSVGLDEHLEAGEVEDVEWVDHIYRGDEVTGFVMKVNDPKTMCGCGTYYRWVALDEKGDLKPLPMYADGTLMPVDKDAVIGLKSPAPGHYGVGNEDEVIWIPGGLKGVLRYSMDAVSQLDMEAPKGFLTVVYNIWDDKGDLVGYVILRSQGDLLYGSAENGWHAIRKNGVLGKNMELSGGPSLTGGATTLEKEDKTPSWLTAELEDVRRKLKEKLPEEDFERISKKLDVEVMMNKSIEERNADLAEIMALVSENSRRSGKRRMRV